MTANQAFQAVRERGWRRGLDNLLRAEWGEWWRTNSWWIHSLIWVGVINLTLASVVWGAQDPEGTTAVGLYSLFGGLFPPIAIIIILQDAIVGEKESGTAAWVLSKPVSRVAFVLSKLIANATGVLVTMVLLPGLVAYLQMSLAGEGWLDPLCFLGGMAVLSAYQLFYLTLTLMLGTLFNHRAPVIAIPLALAFGQNMLLSMAPFLSKVLPWTLIAPLGETGHSVAESVILKLSDFTLFPLVPTLILIGVFIAVSLWRFEQEEF